MRNVAIVCAFLFLSFHANAQTYLNCDFGSGIPADFTLIDADGNTPSADMQKLGFKVGTPWIATYPNGEKDLAACSTSWYTPKGQSDDLMITSAIEIKSAKTSLSWRAKAQDSRYRDGYAVYISTKGTAKEDFDTSKPAFSVDQEESAWTSHSLDLSEYNGKTIYIAYVNNSNNKSRLFVDDIIVGVPSSVYLKVDMPSVTNSFDDLTVSGRAFTNNDEPVKGFTIGLEYDGNTYTQTFDSTLMKGKEIAFSLDNPLRIGKHETKSYSVWISHDNDKFENKRTMKSYGRKIVTEETTATTCTWCVRGIVYLNRMAKKYPKSFIGMAVHDLRDVMEVDDYNSALADVIAWSGDPSVIVDRKHTGDPTDLESLLHSAAKDEKVSVALDLTASADKSTHEVQSTTTLYFENSNDNANYRLGYYVYEDSVHKANDKRYQQSNAYSGSSQDMDGWEKKSDPIPSSEMYFPEVVRGFDGDFNGIEGSVPANITADEPISYSHSFTLPNNIMNYDNVYLVVALIDKSDNHIITAEKVRLNGTSDGIGNIQSADGNTIIKRYSTSGMILSKPQKGINILKLANGKTVKELIK